MKVEDRGVVKEEGRRGREREKEREGGGDKRKADGHGRNLWWQESRARVIIGRIAIRMDELYRRGLRCAQRMPARGPIAQPGIDTRSYAIINVSFASGIDRPLYWQFIHRSPFSTHPNHSPILVGSIQCERLCLKCFPMFFSIYIYIF